MIEQKTIESALKKVEEQQENLGGFMDRFDIPEHWAVREALEKQIAKKPKYLPLKEGITLTNYECPICGCRRLGHGIDLDKCYCPECGQKLDWSEV